jgi:hypothetical protein
MRHGSGCVSEPAWPSYSSATPASPSHFSGGDVHDPADNRGLARGAADRPRGSEQHPETLRRVARGDLGRARISICGSLSKTRRGIPFYRAFSLEELELLRLGPSSIKRRVKVLEGNMELESGPGRGSKLAIRVPL